MDLYDLHVQLAVLASDENAAFMVQLAHENGLPIRAVVGFAINLLTGGFVVSADGAIAGVMEELNLMRSQPSPPRYQGEHRR